MTPTHTYYLQPVFEKICKYSVVCGGIKTIIFCPLLMIILGVALYANPPVKSTPPKNINEAVIIEQLKEWDFKLISLKTDFFQEINFEEAGLKKTIKGAMRYLKPNYLKINHLTPEKQTIITDKKILWIYKPADRQVIKTNWNNWFKQNNQLSGILDFGNYAELVKNNNVKIKTNDSSEIIVDFISKKEPSLYNLTLKLSSTDYFPLGAILSVGKTIISTKLQNTEKNVYISTDTFKFTPPKTAEVIEFGDVK
ncbi:MAG: outer-membrane lipoprotein carrier protein LolA [Elusimicrobia bacterium]|nr:outer-membrane lipoprotein carrier protein LolA [Elusimicrobiota bacterium]